ncbi:MULTISPECIES: erythromycin esterase family protein [Sphingobacterium]|uniref:erythromycin esterase family protein n=1 Tax=Sphingobacterium TaxID=28453 RepID=UPI0013D9592A|nr:MULTISPECIES: erythromycin esterase family protein [unclassified Sphingobacterium]
MRISLKITSAIILFCLCSYLGFAQRSLNLDFELKNYATSLPKRWYAGGEGFKVYLDSVEKHSGKWSLAMEKFGDTNGKFGVYTGRIPIEAFVGKNIEYKGWIKTKHDELAKLQKYIYPLRTYEPDEGSTKDLKVLDRLIGNSKVVALGEVSHGSSEIFKMKNRIIQYLAMNKGFDIFSIEANMPESYKLNRYVAPLRSECIGFYGAKDRARYGRAKPR